MTSPNQSFRKESSRGSCLLIPKPELRAEGMGAVEENVPTCLRGEVNGTGGVMDAPQVRMNFQFRDTRGAGMHSGWDGCPSKRIGED